MAAIDNTKRSHLALVYFSEYKNLVENVISDLFLLFLNIGIFFSTNLEFLYSNLLSIVNTEEDVGE